MAEAELSLGPEQTEALGARLAARLRPGDVVLLRGEVGAGKTTFVRGALRALGHTGPVTSPTFTLEHVYELGGDVRAAHLDLHRLEDLGTEEAGLLDEELGEDVIAFVEWPEAARAQVAGRVVAEVSLEHAGGDSRRVTVA